MVQRNGMGMDKSWQPLLQPASSYHETMGTGNGWEEKTDSKFGTVHSSCMGRVSYGVGRKEGKWWDYMFLMQIGWSD